MTDAERSLEELIGSDYRKAQIEREVIKDAVEALKKQVPMKPDRTTITFHGISGICETEDWVTRQEECYECPVCEGFLGYAEDCKDGYYQCNYCSSCGQAIDWGEDESNE